MHFETCLVSDVTLIAPTLPQWSALMHYYVTSGHRLPGPELRVPRPRGPGSLGGDSEMSPAANSAVAQTLPSLI